MLFEVGRNTLDNKETPAKALGRLELRFYVVGERLLGLHNITLAAASADAFRSVNDAPHGGSGRAGASLAFGRLEPQARRFFATRHRLSHSESHNSVTSSLPCGLVACNSPLRMALRSELTVIGPSGKNFSTAWVKL